MDQATAFADVAKALLLGPSRMTNGGQRFLPLVLNTTFPPNQRLEALSFFEQQLMQIREIEATADAAWIYSYDSQKAIESRSEEAGSSPTTTMSAQDKEAIIREWKKLQLLATNAQERLSRFRSRCQSTRARLSTALVSLIPG
ncbi:hypothetical protein MMC12_006593 [Toensbergia leucococca]|nr:hypothetical protein [Toensbergia leucococca]